MTHFAFPNVEVLHAAFIGCGRYLAAPSAPGADYTAPTSVIINQAAADRAIALLTHEAASSGACLYEKKDRPDKKYVGESMHLAYFLASCHRLRRLHRAWPRDIWSSGRIAIADDRHPLAQEVGSEEEFALKLAAFLAEENPDTLFIVPAANMRPARVERCRAAQATVLSLDDFRALPAPEGVSGKIILTLRPDELDALILALFAPGPNPYNGLDAFDEADAARFFGREAVIQTLCQAFLRLHDPSRQGAPRMLTVLGPSGSGKSSVVRAGLLPRLKQMYAPDAQIAVFACSARPLASLANALSRLLESAGKHGDNASLKQPNHEGNWDGLATLAGEFGGKPLVIVADQCEEMYSLCDDPQERAAFLASLLQASTAAAPAVSVILTLRSDFLEQTQTFPEFNNAIVNQSVIVPVMTRANLREAIEQPAKLAGYRFAPELAERLIAETEGYAGALPLLEFTLTRLWEGMREGDAPEKTLERVGGVGGALADRAEQMYHALSRADKRLARTMFLNLVRAGKEGQYSRKRAALADMPGFARFPEQIQDILQTFSEPHTRLLTSSVDAEGNAVVEITHEALISRWQRLRKWLELDREFHAWRERLDAAIRQWKAAQNDDGALLRGRLLSEAEEWREKREDDLTGDECDFIQRSQRHFAGEEARWKALYEQAQCRALEAHYLSSRALFAAHDELRSLLEGVKAGKMLRDMDAPPELRQAVIRTLRDAAHGICEAMRLKGHHAPVRCLSISPDSKTLASGSHAGALKLWDIEHGRELLTLHGHTDVIRAVCFSPNGKWLLSAGDDGIVKVWDVAAGREIAAMRDHRGGVCALAFSHDGSLLASGGADGAILLRDGAEYREIGKLAGQGGAVSALAFQPGNPALLASGGDDAAITLWHLNERRAAQTLRGHQQAVLSLAFHPGGDLLASGGGDAVVKLWSIAAGREIAELRGHFEAVNGVAFHPNGGLLASASADKTVKLWDVGERRETLTLRGHDDDVLTVAFTPDGARLASGGWDRAIRLWEVSRLKPAHYPVSGGGINAICFHPTRPLLAVGTQDGAVALWDTSPPREITRQRGHRGAAWCAAFSPDGRWLASGGDDGAARLWNAADGEEAAVFSGHADAVLSVAFSPDSRLLASGSRDHTIRLRRVEDGRDMAVLAGHADEVWRVCFTPDGKRLLSASWRGDHTLAVWNIAERRMTQTLLIPDWPPAKSGIRFALHPDGNIAATSTNANGTIMLWNLAAGQEIRALRGHSQTILSLDFSPDGTLLASGSEDNTVKLWQVADGGELATLKPHANDVRSVAFSRDGLMLASGGLDGRLAFRNVREACHVDLDELLAQGCGWLRSYLAHHPDVPKEERDLCDEN